MSNISEDDITLLCDLCGKPCFEGGSIHDNCAGKSLKDMLHERWPNIGFQVSFSRYGLCYIEYWCRYYINDDIEVLLKNDIRPEIKSYSIFQHEPETLE